MYPRKISLVEQKLVIVVGGGTQNQRKKIHMSYTNKNPKQNLSEFDSENEATEFLRSILMQSLEETCLSRLSLFLKEKNYLQKNKPLNC